MYAILGSVGGIVAFLTAIVIIGRGIFKQVDATEDNTRALKEMTAKVDQLFDKYNDHETRLRVLEDRDKR